MLRTHPVLVIDKKLKLQKKCCRLNRDPDSFNELKTDSAKKKLFKFVGIEDVARVCVCVCICVCMHACVCVRECVSA